MFAHHFGYLVTFGAVFVRTHDLHRDLSLASLSAEVRCVRLNHKMTGITAEAVVAAVTHILVGFWVLPSNREMGELMNQHATAFEAFRDRVRLARWSLAAAGWIQFGNVDLHLAILATHRHLRNHAIQRTRVLHFVTEVIHGIHRLLL